jgi:hypothetical protein
MVSVRTWHDQDQAGDSSLAEPVQIRHSPLTLKHERMLTMPLYQVQDPDRPLYVVAKDFGDAVRKWQRIISDENNGDTGDPQGVVLLCKDDEIVIGEQLLSR